MTNATYLPLTEAAHRLGISVDALRRRIRAGEISAQRELRAQGYRWLVAVPDDLPDREEAANTLIAPANGIPNGSLAELVTALTRLSRALDAAPLAPEDYVPAATSRQIDATLRSSDAQAGTAPGRAYVAERVRPWWRRLLWA